MKTEATRPTRLDYLRWSAPAFALIVLHLVLYLLSPRFAAGPTRDKPVIALVVVQVIAGAAYLLLVWGLRRSPGTRPVFTGIVLVGVIMRGLMMFSTPMLEVD